jgi:D-tyrosyl-tRNA(Tyr) deacylase
MRLVIQRVKRAQVDVLGETVGAIGTGLLVLIGVAPEDGPPDVKWCADKIVNLRLFPEADNTDGMELSLADVQGGALLVSQFTLMGDCRKGRRPSWTGAARPELAEVLYQDVCLAVREHGIQVATGRFRTEMEVSLTNWGPVTVVLDSPKRA